MSIIRRGMTNQERFHYVMWLVSLVTYGAFLWFCIEYGVYATNTSPIAAIAGIVFLTLVIATGVSHVSFADTGSRMRVFFTYALPIAVSILTLADDRDWTYSAIYVMGVAVVFMALYFLIDIIFLRERPKLLSEDEDGSVEALRMEYPH